MKAVLRGKFVELSAQPPTHTKQTKTIGDHISTTNDALEIFRETRGNISKE